MRAYWELYKKDIRSIAFFIGVIALLIVGWHFFLLYKSTGWGSTVTFGLSFIPLFFLPVAVLWLGFQSFRQEWKDDTIYYLLSLPHSGWQLTGIKFLVGITFYIGLSLLVVLLILFSYSGLIEELIAKPPIEISKSFIMGYLIRGLILYWITGAILYILSQFSYLISRFYNRFNGGISIIVFLLSQHLIFRGGSILAPLFTWLPDIPVEAHTINNGIVSTEKIYIGSGPLIGSFIMVILIFITGSVVLERHLEV